MRITKHLEERRDIQDISSLKHHKLDPNEVERLEREIEKFAQDSTLFVIRKYVGKDKIISSKEFASVSRIHIDTLNNYLRHYASKDCNNKLTLKRIVLGLGCFWKRIVAHNGRKFYSINTEILSKESAMAKAEDYFKEELLMAFGQIGSQIILLHELNSDLQPLIDLNYERANNKSHLKNKKTS